MKRSQKTTYKLASNELIYTPGVLRWVQAIRRHDVSSCRTDLGARRHFIRAMFPELPEKAVKLLAAGEYTVDGDTVVVVA